jgi:hypothetical protein
MYLKKIRIQEPGRSWYVKNQSQRTSWFWALENSQNQRTTRFSYSKTLGELQGFMKEPEVI